MCRVFSFLCEGAGIKRPRKPLLGCYTSSMGFFERFRVKPISAEGLATVHKAEDDLLDARVGYERSLARSGRMDLLREQEALKIERELLVLQPSEKNSARIIEIDARMEKIDGIIESAEAEAEKKIRS